MGLLDQLQSFGQGASNSAASNVTAPVDGLAWLLRKMGVPVPSDPVGGSDWAAKQGLTATPKNHVAGLLGEAIGGVAPMLAAAKAPQIAKGLLHAEANAMAPRTLNPQTGAIVWHGSPHKFDKFDASKIGTGEGAQAYGHGLYLAENPAVATEYSKMGSGAGGQIPSPLRFVNGSEVQPGTGAYKAASLLDSMSVAQARKTVNGWLQSARPEEVSYFKEVADTLQTIGSKSAVKQKAPGGSMYKVDLPDDAIAKMLDWDKPLSQQPKAVQTAYKKYLKSPQASEHAKSWTRYSDGMRLDQAEPLLKNPGGENLYKNAFPSREAANQWALENGIPGIRYLDGASRGAGQGSSNFVVFPGNEGLLSILERNGQSLK